MVDSLKEKWKYSSLRFYVLNTVWNYGFWIRSKKIYREVAFFQKDFFRINKKKVTKRRFEGYRYEGKTYLDNPGIQNIERDVWDVWKKKGLI